MRTLPLLALIAVPLIASPALADVIPGDDACGPGEHWEGHHDGRCVSDCSVSAPGRGGAAGAGWAFAVGLLALRRRPRG